MGVEKSDVISIRYRGHPLFEVAMRNFSHFCYVPALAKQADSSALKGKNTAFLSYSDGLIRDFDFMFFSSSQAEDLRFLRLILGFSRSIPTH